MWIFFAPIFTCVSQCNAMPPPFKVFIPPIHGSLNDLYYSNAGSPIEHGERHGTIDDVRCYALPSHSRYAHSHVPYRSANPSLRKYGG